MTPNKENIRKWVEALRSGDYTQTWGRLAHVRGGKVVAHCCLGVACDAAGVRPTINNANEAYYDGADICLPQSTQDWLGLGSTEPQVAHHSGWSGRRALTGLNDDEGLSFAEIADLIEAEWLS